MARRKLTDVTRREPQQKTALGQADELIGQMEAQEPSGPAEPEAKPIRRNTARLSISLLPEERKALEMRMGQLWQQGHTDIKVSRLVRIGLSMLLQASDEEILRLAEEVPNLEKRG